jgi:hypothetical protein
MPKTLLALLTLTVLLAVVSAIAAAPPEGPSAKMAFDEVGRGLDRYRKEKGSKNRIRWLEKLAPTRDPRLAVELGDAWGGRDRDVGSVAGGLLWWYYYPMPEGIDAVGTMASRSRAFADWWQAHKADFRRRAALLPP